MAKKKMVSGDAVVPYSPPKSRRGDDTDEEGSVMLEGGGGGGGKRKAKLYGEYDEATTILDLLPPWQDVAYVGSAAYSAFLGLLLLQHLLAAVYFLTVDRAPGGAEPIFGLLLLLAPFVAAPMAINASFRCAWCWCCWCWCWWWWCWCW